MRFEEITNEVSQLLGAAQGRFLTAYQICQQLEQMFPQVWLELIAEYPSVTREIPMGEGTGQQYSPASFVANALKHFYTMGSVVGLRQEALVCEGVIFSGIAPGFTGNTVGIWARDAQPCGAGDAAR